MCLIVDTNIAHLALCDPGQHDFEPVYRSLFGDGRPEQNLVYGGGLASEYDKSGPISEAVEKLLRMGRARREEDKAVDDEAKRIAPQCKSNDAHVIALARLSGVRLLCTRDARSGLMHDFGNKGLLAKPRGKVYNRRSHSHLLARRCRCRKCKGKV